MKILITENDYSQKHKIWRLLCMATKNAAEMDFISGTINDGDEIGKFQGVSINIENDSDTRSLSSFISYWMEFEAYNDPDGITGEHEDDDI